MSLSAAVIDALVATGATVEQLAAAVKADLAEAEQRAARQIPWPLLRKMAFERDGHKCVYCEDEGGPFEVDHIIAKANGGEDILENVCVACRPCNRAKKDRGEEEWSDLAARRARDRERKREERANRRGQSKVVHGQNRKSSTSTDTAPNEVSSNPPPPSGTEVPSGGKRVRAKPTFELPSIVPGELWEAFEQMRRDKKKPMSDFSRKQLSGKLENIAAAGWNIEDVMTKAIINQHDGFWMPDGRDSNIRRANEPRAGPVNMDEYRERLQRIGQSDATH